MSMSRSIDMIVNDIFFLLNFIQWFSFKQRFFLVFHYSLAIKLVRISRYRSQLILISFTKLILFVDEENGRQEISVGRNYLGNGEGLAENSLWIHRLFFFMFNLRCNDLHSGSFFLAWNLKYVDVASDEYEWYRVKK